MKKAITITFGLMGLIFGLVFTSTKIYAYNNSSPTYIYWTQEDGNGISILAPELSNSTAGRFNFFDFIEQWDHYYDTVDLKNALITIDSVKIDYNDTTNNKKYIGYIDQINIFTNNISDYIYITFYYQGNNTYAYELNNYDVIQGTFIITESVMREFGDIRYDSGYRQGYSAGHTVGLELGQQGSEEIYKKAYDNAYQEAKDYYYQLGMTDGYELISEVEFEKGFQQGLNDGYTNGYNKGYQEGISTVYENGFGGLINPDTNNPYDETASYPYGKGYNDGFTSTESGGLWNVMFSALLAPFQVLGFELLPGVTLGMIVAVPLVFGLLAWILSVGKSKK